ncbi:lef-2 [Hyposidra talaca nucleopolyhedrovirus]|uniref:Lef-2 n=1 Tax=Hyposidra talaca nucleopolyhedrovirus TaxID=1070315 RepID=A0A2Z4HI67_9ABAC|nr:lef-2 [Hyposidra talaca nucleopolyhedrovirus]AWW14475.1 lef-2 [Hyposidra talaca nucleopolyhedrovirus]
MQHEAAIPLSPLEWKPSQSNKSIDKKRDYVVPMENFDFDVTCYTRFTDDGQSVVIPGLRLFYLVKNQIERDETQSNVSATSFTKKKSCRNVCFKQALSSKQKVIDLLRSSLKLPRCMDSLLQIMSESPRGNRYRKRFVLNCYVANLLTCTKCNKSCLIAAMNVLYEHDDKCVREFFSLINKTLYKPPNCVNMKTDKLCDKNSNCKGSNPLCNN